ncbi:LuxR family transcriptional regulator [Dactylosporangium siamense]|uniref:helix-turn-helix transcriptional regulator n=1 Tax=Dactylosporangium siamense TaxID=685454 RepID=UPI002FED4D56
MRANTNRPELRGRRREREALDRLLRDVRAGHSRVLVLRGEAGIGKSALLEHLTGASSTVRVARAAGVEPETEIAYSALQQLCAPLLGHLGALPEPQRAALATGLGLSAGDPPEALLVGLAVLGLLAEAAAERPLVCVVDDVQWLDRMSEVILTFVARRVDAESVALVFAARSPGGDRFLAGLPELRVDGLPTADARALLDSVLPGPVDDRIRDRIVAETHGNPLALLELPRGSTPAELAFGFGAPGPLPPAGETLDAALFAPLFAPMSPAGAAPPQGQERGPADPAGPLSGATPGPADQAGQGFGAGGAAADTAPPASQGFGAGGAAADTAPPAGQGFGAGGTVPLAGQVEEGFRRRIAALPADTRLLLLAAAVEPVGDVALLWRAAGRLGVGMDAAAPAQAAGLVDIGALVRFRHPLVRSAAWRAADPATLRDVHRALADVTDPDLDPDRRAWHRAHAAADADEDVAGELERSADRALARGGRAAAAAFLERAAELTRDPKHRSAVLLAAARARLDAGAAALVQDLVAAAELGPLGPVQQGVAERLRAQAALALNPGRAAGPPLLAAARRLEELDSGAARETYLAAVGAAVHAGRLGGDDLHRAAEAARGVPAGTDATGRLLTGLVTWALDGPAPAAADLRLALDAIDPARDLDLLWLAAPAAHEVFQAGTAHRLSGQAVGFARATGALSLLPAALTFHAGTLLLMGRFADAADVLAEGAALASATGVPLPPDASLTLAAYRDPEPEALRRIEDAAADAEARGEGILLGQTWLARAVLHNGTGNAPAALHAARQAADGAELALAGRALPELVEAAARAGEPTVATGARDRLAELATAAGTDWSLGVLALADALTAAPQRAEAHYQEAVARCDAAGLGLLTARARLQHGEWLRREGRRADARAELRAAHDALAGMGAGAFAGRAARELAATGETVRKRSEGPSDELTAQETQIARLAVAGQTNPEIGAALFLSPRTVEWHLRKVFAKLGITSRRELAAALR